MDQEAKLDTPIGQSNTASPTVSAPTTSPTWYRGPFHKGKDLYRHYSNAKGGKAWDGTDLKQFIEFPHDVQMAWEYAATHILLDYKD